MATTNKIVLDKTLVDEFKTYQKNIRENTILLAQKAYLIRSQYLAADGKKYDGAFEKWWALHNLNSVFGGRPNFTKWASSGEALEKAKFNKYSDRMPHSLNALYEVSRLSPDELKMCLEDTFTRSSLTDEPKRKSKKPTPLINPETTAAAIKSWREKWLNPKPKSTEKRRLDYATIKVHGSLYDFDGIFTVERLEKIHETLIHAMKPFDGYILLETKFTELIEGHRKRQEQAQERERKKSAEKKRKKSKR